MRRLLVTEVVQSSAMDCGPASLKALLEGFGIRASYGRLREACQTGVDGSSIDDLENTAVALGLDAEQVMVPSDHVLLPCADTLPALLVVRLPSGATHFVVAWRRHRGWIQVMDPATGRRWTRCSQLESELFRHTQTVPAEDWRTWAGSNAFLSVLRWHMRQIGIARDTCDRLVATALADSTWRSLAALDAAVRMTASVVRSKGVRPGREATLLAGKLAQAGERIPSRYWCVQIDPASADHLLFHGAVLLRVHGRRNQPVEHQTLSPELSAALEERATGPARELWRMMRLDGLLAPVVVGAALAMAAGSVAVEGLLFRGLLDLWRDLALSGQRLGALAATFLLLAALLLVEWPLNASLLRFSRKLECRFRLAFLRKIPRLTDRYFHSRLISDMAERSHSVHQLREVPQWGAQFLRSAFSLAATAAGIAWFFPSSAWLAAAAGILMFIVPLGAQSLLHASDLRARNYGGALGRFYLDALLGATAIRAHGADRPVCREYDTVLAQWARANLERQRSAAKAEALQLFLGTALAAAILLQYIANGGSLGALLLLAYWALNLPVIGQEAATAAWQYPRLRNITLRLLEPLGAPEERCGESGETAHSTALTPDTGLAVLIDRVSVRASGHTILEDIHIDVPPGSHIAIVGSSGAGKSSLVGLLLGWHRPASGCIRIDGQILDGRLLERMRQEVAWVDPQVQIWNRSLLDNLRYGSSAQAASDMEGVLEAADLTGVLHKLPGGMQSVLGEGGALVSGGEGQRVRIGRAMLRREARMVVLDEPGRGLDRQARSAVIRQCRERWSQATLFCITHDVADTLRFPRVLVIDGGRLVEDGAPDRLATRPNSRYRALLDAEAGLRRVWSDRLWRRFTLREGVLEEREERTASCRAD